MEWKVGKGMVQLIDHAPSTDKNRSPPRWLSSDGSANVLQADPWLIYPQSSLVGQVQQFS